MAFVDPELIKVKNLACHAKAGSPGNEDEPMAIKPASNMHEASLITGLESQHFFQVYSNLVYIISYDLL
jgi:hypothetical protein